MSVLKITGEDNTPFTVRIVRNGDTYGLNNWLTHTNDEPLVEVYDARYNFTEYGQLISRYFLSTVARTTGILCMDGGVPAWTLGDREMEEVRSWLKEQVPNWESFEEF